MEFFIVTIEGDTASGPLLWREAEDLRAEYAAMGAIGIRIVAARNVDRLDVVDIGDEIIADDAAEWGMG